MKRKILSVLGVFFGGMLFAQTLVSTIPENRKAVMEEFTRIHCGLCPAGNVIANNILDNNPGQVILMGLHTGVLAIPNPGEPDFRTTEGQDIANHFNLGGTPKAMVNRSPWNSATVLSSGVWASAVQNVLGQTSPVNVGLMSEFDAVTRELTVTVEIYYTDDSQLPSNFINVALTESGIIGWQTDYQNGNQPNYEHNHVLRGYITDTWGDEVTTTTSGTFESRTYTYTVPSDFDIDNCHVVAFVSETRSGIYNGTEVEANGGTTATGVGIDEQFESVLGHAFPNPARDRIQIPLTQLEQGATLRLIDLAGRVLHEQQVAEGQNLIDLDLSAFPIGLYSYQLIGNNGATFARKLQVLH